MAHIHIQLHSKNTFPNTVKSGLLSCSPTIDLTATIDDEFNVVLWRPNSELVIKGAERNLSVHALAWKPDGQFLAVGWSDGGVRLMGLENNKAVHHIRPSEGFSSRITHIAWARNLIGSRRNNATRDDRLSWDEKLEKVFDDKRNNDLLNLPHELTFLEVDSTLPNLSPLPVSGGSGDDDYVFSTRTSLSFIFRAIKAEDTDAVDCMIVGTDDGGIHVSIYDSFIVGSLRYPPQTSKVALQGAWQLCGQASHPEVSTHALLFRPSDGIQSTVALVPLDLCFVHSSPINLCLLASKTTALQNLLRYAKQTQIHMVSEWRSTRELPGRFISNFAEGLQKMPDGRTTVAQALFHTVTTGHVYGATKEWLVDSLAERGHKRWVKAVSTGLENLRNLVHQNMLPALERCGVILSRLLGLAKYHDGRSSIGYSPSRIKKLMEITTCLNVICHRILLEVMEEIDLFGAFSTWLRFEIDRLASPSASDELTEREATLDIAKVLAYIQGYLTASPLSTYLEKATQKDQSSCWDYLEEGVPPLEALEKLLKRQTSSRRNMRALTQVDFLVTYLATKAGEVFKDVAEAERRSVRFGKATKLDIGHRVAKCDSYMSAVRSETQIDGVAYTALLPEDRSNQIFIFRTAMSIINGISSSVDTTASALALGNGRIVDFGFLDDSSLLVLWADEDYKPELLTIPYQSREMPWLPCDDGTAPQVRQLSPETVRRAFRATRLPHDGTFDPVQMEVRGRTNERGDMPARVALLGHDLKTYRVFAL